MRKKVFESLVEKQKSTRKWLFFPLSALVHFFVVAAVIVLPLMSVNADMPQAKIVKVIIAAPAPPLVPHAAPAEGSSKKVDDKVDKVVKKPKPVTTNRFVAPVEIPNEIAEEDIGFGIGDGGPGGVPGGVPGGLPGGVIGGAILGEGDIGLKNPLRHSIVEPPRLIKRVEPQYPHVAIKAHVYGIVIVHAVTDVFGRVVKARAISGNPLLKTAALQAVKQWVYEPYIINGVPKPVAFTVSITFKLQR